MAEYIIDKIEYGGNVYKLQDSVSDFLTGAVTALSTTEGQHSTITNQNGAVSIAIPTKTSHLTNDSGFITSFTDENVKNTAVTAATTYYLTGSTSSSTATGGLSKHAAIKAYVTANSGTGGSARIDLGNTTATTSAGGKEGILRLYGTSATYYIDLKAGAPSANRTITFPNKTGTVALTSDIPDVSGFSTTDEKVKATSLSTIGTSYLVMGSNSGNAETKNYSSKLAFEYGSSQVVLKIGDTTDGQKGRIYLYGSNTGGVTYLDTTATVSRAITFPNKTGTVALTSDIPTVPTITLNGTSTTTPSFYAPTTAGTNGYFLKSNGSGAPTWAEIETTAAQIVRW